MSFRAKFSLVHPSVLSQLRALSGKWVYSRRGRVLIVCILIAAGVREGECPVVMRGTYGITTQRGQHNKSLEWKEARNP